MVRIVGGRARGTQIRVPRDAPTRPTTDRVREALFNVLAHRFEDACRDAQVLDLFAGSGALGLEAMSRGAAHVQFVDNSPAATRQIKANADQIGGRYTVSKDTAQNFLQGKATQFGLIFLDPPYRESLLTPSLRDLSKGGWLTDNSVICLECAEPRNLEYPPGYSERFARRYGKTTIMILSYNFEVSS